MVVELMVAAVNVTKSYAEFFGNDVALLYTVVGETSSFGAASERTSPECVLETLFYICKYNKPYFCQAFISSNLGEKILTKIGK